MKKDLIIIWFDIAKAYRLIPLNLIQNAFKRAHVPENYCVCAVYCVCRVYLVCRQPRIKSTTKKLTIKWQYVKKCTIAEYTRTLTEGWYFLHSPWPYNMLVMSVSVKGSKMSPENAKRSWCGWMLQRLKQLYKQNLYSIDWLINWQACVTKRLSRHRQTDRRMD